MVGDGIRYYAFVWGIMGWEGVLPTPPLSAIAVPILPGKNFHFLQDSRKLKGMVLAFAWLLMRTTRWIIIL